MPAAPYTPLQPVAGPVLGLADLAFDSGAALVVDGQLVAAVAEERRSRIKHGGGFPHRALEEVLQIGGVLPRELAAVSLVGTRDWTGRLLASALDPGGGALRPLDSAGDRTKVAAYEGYLALSDALGPLGQLDHRLADRATAALLAHHGVRAPRRRVDHHRCHAAASFYTSGFDRAVALVADARGDGDRALSIFACEGQELHLLASTPVQASLGYLYGACTELAGFLHNSEEGKLNALAAHGRRTPLYDRLDQAWQVVGLQLRCTRPGRHRGRLSVLDLAAWLGRDHRPEDLAWAVQHLVEDRVCQLARHALQATGLRHLVLGGGLFLNVGLNLALAELPQVAGLHIFPAAGDSGTCAGAALDPVRPRSRALPHAFLGAGFQEQEARQALGTHPFERPPDLEEAVAARLVAGQVVAWVQGRAEHGPRALGHRSLLALAQDPASPDRLRQTVKDRPAFQPFCPSMTRRAARQLLDWPDSVDPRFMIVTARARPAFQQACPAAVHTDGTVRVQVVDPDVAPRWHALLQALGRRTGLEVVLNTSLNRSGEPMCYRPAHAVDLFEHTTVDALALGPFLLARSPAP